MSRNREVLEVVPSARRLMGSLRDVGYDFRHAVADLVDNSIEAGATAVAIDMQFDAEDSWIRISDNGVGMSGSEITEAMRFGSERDYDANDLGKFGLGLKTASLSQCTKFTVASRVDPKARRIEVRQWDLDHVERTNRWEVINLPVSERSAYLVEPLRGTTGTVVLWERLDRVLGYKVPWGEFAKKAFLGFAEELDNHLAMVFHRFLSGEARRRQKLSIRINDTDIEPWDPFARTEDNTISLPKIELEITGDDGPGIVSVKPYILPPQDKFSSRSAFDYYSGPRKWNSQQGFYVYRADRMIQSGGWSYMRAADEHIKLARAAVDFRPDLDSAFDLNVSKARVNFPTDLRSKLKPVVEQYTKRARDVYSSKSSQISNDPHRMAFNNRLRPNENSGFHGKKDSDASDQNNLSHIGGALEAAARRVGEMAALRKIQNALKRRNPAEASKIGW